jgi:hypothetical protein
MAVGNERLAAAPMVAMSPDGRHIAYRAISDSVRQIFLRALDQQEASAVAGTQDAGQPIFSPDSQWLGFEVRGELKKVPVSGGAPVTLTPGAPLAPGIGLAWAGRSIILSGLSGLQQLPDAGGTPQLLTVSEKGMRVLVIAGPHGSPRQVPCCSRPMQGQFRACPCTPAEPVNGAI